MKRTPIKRKTPLERSRNRIKSGNGNRIPLDRRSEIEWRCKGRCEARTPVCTEHQQDIHHILPRSAGGSHHRANLLGVCRACHRWIEEHREASYKRGWLRHRWDGEYADVDEMARVLFAHATGTVQG